jgi:hypothetical protein
MGTRVRTDPNFRVPGSRKHRHEAGLAIPVLAGPTSSP